MKRMFVPLFQVISEKANAILRNYTEYKITLIHNIMNRVHLYSWYPFKTNKPSTCGTSGLSTQRVITKSNIPNWVVFVGTANVSSEYKIKFRFSVDSCKRQHSVMFIWLNGSNLSLLLRGIKTSNVSRCSTFILASTN